MKKVFFSFLGFAAMVCLICGTVFADYNNVTIYVNDKVVQSSQPGVVINDTTFVPVRIVSETLGCNVEWNEAEQCVTITKENIILNMTVTAYERFLRVQIQMLLFLLVHRTRITVGKMPEKKRYNFLQI